MASERLGATSVVAAAFRGLVAARKPLDPSSIWRDGGSGGWRWDGDGEANPAAPAAELWTPGGRGGGGSEFVAMAAWNFAATTVGRLRRVPSELVDGKKMRELPTTWSESMRGSLEPHARSTQGEGFGGGAVVVGDTTWRQQWLEVWLQQRQPGHKAGGCVGWRCMDKGGM